MSAARLSRVAALSRLTSCVGMCVPDTLTHTPPLNYPQQICGLELRNGLISRRFVTSPAFGTVDYVLNASTSYGGEQSMFRTVKPEALVTINGTTLSVGGLLQTQALPTVFLAYANRSDFALGVDTTAFQVRRVSWIGATVAVAPRWVSLLSAFPRIVCVCVRVRVCLQFVSYQVTTPQAPFPWTPGSRHSPVEYAWPPRGVVLEVLLTLADNSALHGTNVTLFYQLLDNAPILSKWMEVREAVCVYLCVHLCVPVCTCVYLCVPVCTCVYLCVPVCTCVYLCDRRIVGLPASV